MLFFQIASLSAIAAAAVVAPPATPQQTPASTSSSSPPSTSASKISVSKGQEATKSTCQFALCTNNPKEKKALEANDFSITAKTNHLAIVARDACKTNRTEPKRTQNMDVFCNFDSVAYSWTALASGCEAAHPCESFLITDDWDMAQKGTPPFEAASQGVWGNLGVYQGLDDEKKVASKSGTSKAS